MGGAKGSNDGESMTLARFLARRIIGWPSLLFPLLSATARSSGGALRAQGDCPETVV